MKTDFRLIYFLVSVSIWFNEITFSVSRASVRIEQVLVIVLLFCEFLVRRQRKLPVLFNPWLVVWLVVGMLATFFGTSDILRGVWIFFLYFLGIISLSTGLSHNFRVEVIRIQARVAIAFSVVYLLFYLFSPLASLFSLQESRELFSGFSLEPNLLGSQSLLLWLLLYFEKNALVGREIYCLYLLPLLILISLTRTVWISFLLISCYLIAKKSKVFSVYFFLLSVLLFPILNGFVLSKTSDTEDFYWNIRNLFNFNSGTALYRQNVYNQAISQISDNPRYLIFGHGYASFPEYHPVDSSGVTSGYLSNAFVGLLFESGLLGLYLFSFLIMKFVIRAQNRREVFLFCFVLGMVSFTTSPLWLIFPWFYLRLLARVEKVQPIS